VAHAPVATLQDAQGFKQLGELGLAFVLSALIGAEREWRQKSAGLRTHTLVGVGSALFLIVSKYGFTDVLEPGRTAFDPSRVAAQIVSGIGFIGGGLIFVRGDIVRGLTTAAIVWMTAAIGMACGAGLALLAIFVTAMHFVIVLGFTAITARLPRGSGLRIVYADGRGILREVLAEATRRGFAVVSVATDRHGPDVALTLDVQGRGSVQELALALDELEGVLEVAAADPRAAD
jgi:putative Mg2+ transporter-C (MgtC) family protein